MKNKLGSGDRLNWTNGTGSAISSGDVVVIGNLLAVASVDIADGESGVVELVGEFDLPKVDAAEITVGETLTWDVSAGAFDDAAAVAATGDLTGACAVALETLGATSGANIRVRLTGVPGTVN